MRNQMKKQEKIDQKEAEILIRKKINESGISHFDYMVMGLMTVKTLVYYLKENMERPDFDDLIFDYFYQNEKYRIPEMFEKCWNVISFIDDLCTEDKKEN